MNFFPKVKMFCMDLFLGEVKGLRIIKYGKARLDKLNIFCWYILLSKNPKFLRRNLPLIGQIIEYLSFELGRRTICVVNNIAFRLVEMTDIYIIESSFEPFMYKYLKVKKGENFMDVGTHIGKYTLQAAKDVDKSGLVIAIEPNPQNYAVLLKNIQENHFSNIIALNIAAWNSNCELDLFPGQYSTLHSLKRSLQEDQGYSSAKPSQKVKSDRLDNVLEKIGLPIHWIKIDVEGAEIEVLQGLEETLKKRHPRLIVECWAQNHSQVRNFVESFGYKTKMMSSTYFYFYWID